MRGILQMRPQDKKAHNDIMGALKSAADAHPEIDYGGHESSITKRILATNEIRTLIDVDIDLTRSMKAAQ